jgi:hypothetical protein
VTLGLTMFPRHRLQLASMLLASGQDTASPRRSRTQPNDMPIGPAQIAYLAKAAGAIPVVDGAEIFVPLDHALEGRWLAYVADRLSDRR